MGEGIDNETVGRFVSVVGLLSFAYLVLRALYLDFSKASRERIKRLDGRKDAE